MSVAGLAVGGGTAARHYQPVAQVDALTGEASGSAATVDGSTPVSGGNGTSVASASNPSPVATYGTATMATGQVAVTTSATLVCAARAGRSSVTISSTSAVVFYVGNTGVTTSTGLYVAGSAGATITLDTQASVYAVGASNVTLSYLEDY